MNAVLHVIRYLFQPEDTLITRPETGAYAPKVLVLVKNIVWFTLALLFFLAVSRIR